MSHPLDFDEANRRRKAEEKRQKLAEGMLKADFQHVLSIPGARRILWQFLQDMGLDDSAFATNAMQQSHNIGQQDAAKWWLNGVRRFCPEVEAAMRVEAARVAAQNISGDDDVRDDD
jgi:hypothetical protein